MPTGETFTFERLVADLRAWQAGLPAGTRDLIDAVRSGARRCFALGRNGHSGFIARHLALAGFIDDSTEPGQYWHDLPVLRGSELPGGAVVINAVLHRRPHQALARLHGLPSAPAVLHYADFTRVDPERFPPLPFVAEAHSAVFGHADEFAALNERLQDPESRRVMHDVVLYRLTGDPAFTRGYTLRDELQYFDLPLGLPASPVFVDGGAYQGETTEMFLRHFPEAAAAHVFEPNSGSMQVVRSRLGEMPRIHLYPYALGDRRARLSFDGSAANASRLADDGGESVEVVRLDDEVDGTVDFIKFDLEGYEPQALAGAQRTIAAQQPALAICVYHYPMDFISVPRVVGASRDDYRLRLRHYTEGWEETVMYFTRT